MIEIVDEYKFITLSVFSTEMRICFRLVICTTAREQWDCQTQSMRIRLPKLSGTSFLFKKGYSAAPTQGASPS